jgi:putative peptidoglycan lipid II flippase
MGPERGMPAADHRSLLTTSLLLTGLSFVGKVLGLLQQSVIAASFGASKELDAFFIASSIPALMQTTLLVGAVTTVLVPVLSELATKDSESEKWQVFSSFLNVVVTTTIVLILVGIAFAPNIIGAYAPGFDAETRQLAVSQLRLLLFSLLFFAVGSVFRGLWHASRIFYVPALAFNINSLSIILAVLIWRDRLGIDALLWGVVLAAAAYMIINFVPVSRVRIRYSVRINLTHPAFKRFASTFGAVAAMAILVQVNNLATRFFATTLSPGSVSIVEYGFKFDLLLTGFFAMAVAVPAYTSLAESSAIGDMQEIRRTISAGVRLVAITTIPLAVLLVLFRIPVVDLWLQRGAFSSEHTQDVASFFLYISPAFVLWSFGQIMVHAFYALEETGLLVGINLINVALIILLDMALITLFQVNGLAMANSIGSLAGAVVLWTVLNKKVGGLNIQSLALFFAKVTLAAGLMGILGRILYSLLGRLPLSESPLFPVIQLAISTGCGALLYVGILLCFGIQEVLTLKNKLLAKFWPSSVR